jgi:hypothetical protein
MLFLFTKYRSLTLLSFESFHIGLVREMFTPRQSTVNEVTRGIRRSIPMMLCGLLSNLLCQWLTKYGFVLHAIYGMQLSYSSKFRVVAVSVPVTWQIRKRRQIPSFSDEHFHAGFSSRKRKEILIIRRKFT